MKIIDTNAINYVLSKNISLSEDYFVTPDVKDESEIAELIFGRALPTNIKDISKEKIFDEAIYISNYKSMLNKHKGRSFYNMTGFGDISILALLAMLKGALQSK